MVKDEYHNRGQENARKRKDLGEKIKETPIVLNNPVTRYTAVDPNSVISSPINPKMYQVWANPVYSMFARMYLFFQEKGF